MLPHSQSSVQERPGAGATHPHPVTTSPPASPQQGSTIEISTIPRRARFLSRKTESGESIPSECAGQSEASPNGSVRSIQQSPSSTTSSAELPDFTRSRRRSQSGGSELSWNNPHVLLRLMMRGPVPFHSAMSPSSASGSSARPHTHSIAEEGTDTENLTSDAESTVPPLPVHAQHGRPRTDTGDSEGMSCATGTSLLSTASTNTSVADKMLAVAHRGLYGAASEGSSISSRAASDITQQSPRATHTGHDVTYPPMATDSTPEPSPRALARHIPPSFGDARTPARSDIRMDASTLAALQQAIHDAVEEGSDSDSESDDVTGDDHFESDDDSHRSGSDGRELRDPEPADVGDSNSAGRQSDGEHDSWSKQRRRDMMTTQPLNPMADPHSHSNPPVFTRQRAPGILHAASQSSGRDSGSNEVVQLAPMLPDDDPDDIDMTFVHVTPMDRGFGISLDEAGAVKPKSQSDGGKRRDLGKIRSLWDSTSRTSSRGQDASSGGGSSGWTSVRTADSRGYAGAAELTDDDVKLMMLEGADDPLFGGGHESDGSTGATGTQRNLLRSGQRRAKSTALQRSDPSGGRDDDSLLFPSVHGVRATGQQYPDAYPHGQRMQDNLTREGQLRRPDSFHVQQVSFGTSGAVRGGQHPNPMVSPDDIESSQRMPLGASKSFHFGQAKFDDSNSSDPYSGPVVHTGAPLGCVLPVGSPLHEVDSPDRGGLSASPPSGSSPNSFLGEASMRRPVRAGRRLHASPLGSTSRRLQAAWYSSDSPGPAATTMGSLTATHTPINSVQRAGRVTRAVRGEVVRRSDSGTSPPVGVTVKPFAHTMWSSGNDTDSSDARQPTAPVQHAPSTRPSPRTRRAEFRPADMRSSLVRGAMVSLSPVNTQFGVGQERQGACSCVSTPTSSVIESVHGYESSIDDDLVVRSTRVSSFGSVTLPRLVGHQSPTAPGHPLSGRPQLSPPMSTGQAYPGSESHQSPHSLHESSRAPTADEVDPSTPQAAIARSPELPPTDAPPSPFAAVAHHTELSTRHGRVRALEASLTGETTVEKGSDEGADMTERASARARVSNVDSRELRRLTGQDTSLDDPRKPSTPPSSQRPSGVPIDAPSIEKRGSLGDLKFSSTGSPGRMRQLVRGSSSRASPSASLIGHVFRPSSFRSTASSNTSASSGAPGGRRSFERRTGGSSGQAFRRSAMSTPNGTPTGSGMEPVMLNCGASPQHDSVATPVSARSALGSGSGTTASRMSDMSLRRISHGASSMSITKLLKRAARQITRKNSNTTAAQMVSSALRNPSSVSAASSLLPDSAFGFFDFDIISLEAQCPRPLLATLVRVMDYRGLWEQLPDLSRDVVISYFEAIDDGYLASNPYHNSTHAASVVWDTQHHLWEGDAVKLLSPVQVFGALTAAAIHDFKHPGVTNKFVVSSNDPLVLEYGPYSVLERFHIDQAFDLARRPGLNIFERFSGETARGLREQMAVMVLATDLDAYKTLREDLTMFEDKSAVSDLAEPLSPMSSAAESSKRLPSLSTTSGEPQDGQTAPRSPRAALTPQQTALMVATRHKLAVHLAHAGGLGRRGSARVSSKRQSIKAASPSLVSRDLISAMLRSVICVSDIGHSAKVFDLHKRWSARIMEEFFRQGDREKEQSLPVSFLCDRETVDVNKSQLGFYDFLVFPLFYAVRNSWFFSHFPGIIRRVEENRYQWKVLADAAAGDEEESKVESAPHSERARLRSAESLTPTSLSSLSEGDDCDSSDCDPQEVQEGIGNDHNAQEEGQGGLQYVDKASEVQAEPEVAAATTTQV